MFNILAADDDINICKLTKFYLDKAGYNSFVAINGNHALEIIENNHIDLAIVDVMMPQKDGLTITDKQVRHIFDQFYQADSSHAVMGHGLGLSIVHKIVTLHNRTITCNNTQKGTTIFTIILPLNS